MSMFRKKDKPVIYTKDEVCWIKSKAFSDGHSEGYIAGRQSAEFEGRTIDERYKLIKARKRDWALKMVDAIAKGTVEQLLDHWDMSDEDYPKY